MLPPYDDTPQCARRERVYAASLLMLCALRWRARDMRHIVTMRDVYSASAVFYRGYAPPLRNAFACRCCRTCQRTLCLFIFILMRCRFACYAIARITNMRASSAARALPLRVKEMLRYCCRHAAFMLTPFFYALFFIYALRYATRHYVMPFVCWRLCHSAPPMLILHEASFRTMRSATSPSH